MPLSLNEIKDRALAFSRGWEGELGRMKNVSFLEGKPL